MAEEEREGLTDFRQTASLQFRHDLAVKFIGFEARNYEGVQPVDRDPATYVARGRARLGRLAEPGSLNSDGMKYCGWMPRGTVRTRRSRFRPTW